MNVFTHIAIGIGTKRAVEDMLPVKLKTFSFLKGSIKPDISRLYRKIPHFIDESNEFVMGEIEKLLNTDMDAYFENEAKYAERLGILTHYISDFFCYAHSNRFKGGFLKHNIYEMKLMLYCAVRFGRVFNTDNYIEDTAEGLPEIRFFLDKLHQRYSGSPKPASLREDMAYTYEACLALCISVLYPRSAMAVNPGRKLVKAII